MPIPLKIGWPITYPAHGRFSPSPSPDPSQPSGPSDRKWRATMVPPVKLPPRETFECPWSSRSHRWKMAGNSSFLHSTILFAFPCYCFSSKRKLLCHLTPHSPIPSNHYRRVWDWTRRKEAIRGRRSHSAEWLWPFQLRNSAQFSVGLRAGGDVNIVFLCKRQTWLCEEVLVSIIIHSAEWKWGLNFASPRWCGFALFCFFEFDYSV